MALLGILRANVAVRKWAAGKDMMTAEGLSWNAAVGANERQQMLCGAIYESF